MPTPILEAADEPRLDPARWVRRGPPGLALWDPASLSDADIRQLWRFRLRYVDLKPEVDPRDDLASYAAFVRKSSYAWISLDRGALIGTAMHHTGQVEFAGETRRYVQSDYGFIARRGRAAAMLSQAYVYTRAYLAAPRAPTFVVGFVYPHSYLVYAGTLRDCWLLGDTGLPAAERPFVEHLARALGGARWDPQRSRCSFPTRPRELRPATSARGRADALARYEALCPDWPAGHGLFFVAPVHLHAFITAARSLVERFRHARRRGTDAP